jgi:hypothetical protein
MGRSYYFRRARVIDGMTVVGAVTVVVALPARFSPDGLIQYAYRVIVCPGVTVADKPYDPLFVLKMHWVVDVGNCGDVEMHASLTAAPDPSRTVPVIVTVGFGLDDVVGVRVGVGGTGCGVSVRSGVAVGASVGARVVRAGVVDADADG